MAAWISSSVAGFAGISATSGASSFIMTLATARASVAVSGRASFDRRLRHMIGGRRRGSVGGG
eukprot:5870082-Pleurochrysis_carterae.AAC.1